MLFRQRDDGRFEDAPYSRIDGPASRLNYPHDVAFAMCGETELLAVAQRAGAIAIYARNRESDTYGPAPVYEITGPNSQLEFSDGVAFVPPHNQYLAVCNLTLATISFYRRLSVSPIRFEVIPEFQLRHPSVARLDGLAFSRCGRWLATANHGNNSVSVFQRRNKILAGGKLRYGPEPVTLIEDPEMRYPHSVAFAPETNHLIVTNAGANYFSVYEPKNHSFGVQWSQSPVQQCVMCPEEAFREINDENNMEGGPKGVAIHTNSIAVCCPEFGVRIYSFRRDF